MRTRRQSTEEKRKAEEDKQDKNLFKRRKLIGPRDITVEPVEVKVEVKTEHLEDEEESHLDTDGGFEVFENYEEIEGEMDMVIDEEKEVVVKVEEEGEVIVKVEEEVVVKVEEEEMVIEEEGEGMVEEEEVGELTVEDELVVIQEGAAEKVLSLVLLSLEQKDVFTCRRVSKQWRKIVDDFIEDLVVPRPYDDKAYLQKMKRSPNQLCPLPKFRIVKYAYKFEKESELEKFNDTMGGHTDSKLSPFVGGATVNLKNLFVNSSILSPATKRFMEKFVVHIRRLEIEHGGPNVDFVLVGFVKCVKECLQFVPNLERLKITGNCLSRSSWNKLRTRMKRLQSGWSRMNKLTSLEFRYFQRPPSHEPFPGRFPPCESYLEYIFSGIMVNRKWQSQIKQLSLDWPNNLLNFKLCNVKELSVRNLYDLKEIKLQLPIEKLTLLEQCDISSKVNFVGLLKKLPHLRYLRVADRRLIACFMDSDLPENNIHTLEIMDTKGYVPKNLNWAVFPKLRYLIIRNLESKYVDFEMDSFFDPELKDGAVKIEHLIYGGTTYATNLWEIFPELEVFTFQFQIHIGYTFNSASSGSCSCFLRKGTKYECLFKNIVETREGYQRYLRKKDCKDSWKLID